MWALHIYQDMEGRLLYKNTAKQYQIVIENAGILPISGIRLSYRNMTTQFREEFTDETFQLTASVNTEEGEAGAVQDYTIEWSSDNSRIAQVDDNGLVTAKKHGNTSIHASVEGYDENGDYYQYSAACSVNVTAAMEGTCGDNLTWKIDEEGNLVISGTGEMYDYTDEYDYDYGKYVSTAPFSAHIVKTLVIEDGVTSIGDYAFYNQDSLSEMYPFKKGYQKQPDKRRQRK